MVNDPRETLREADRVADEAACLLDVARAALRLFVSPEYVRRLIRDGKLPAIRLSDGPRAQWRIDPKALETFIAQRNYRRAMQSDGTAALE